MRKFIFIFAFLLNLLPVMNNGKISLTGAITASAQNMGNEGGGYWCDDEEIGKFLSAVPCDDVCVTVCSLCHESLPCDEQQSHICGTTDDNDNYNGNYGNNGNDEDFFGDTNGGGGGGSGSSTGTSGHKKTPNIIKSGTKQAANSIPGKDSRCNKGVIAAFKNIYGYIPKGMNCLANQMITYWEKNPSLWKEIKLSEAQGYANQGYFVVAGYKNPHGHGHVVVIVPGTESYSNNWEAYIPNTMDTGYHMRSSSQKFSLSFGKNKKGKVKFYLFK